MSGILMILLMIIATFIIFCICCYIFTFSKRRENKEKLKTQSLLYYEKIRADQAKRIARNAGERARELINEIAEIKDSQS